MEHHARPVRRGAAPNRRDASPVGRRGGRVRSGRREIPLWFRLCLIFAVLVLLFCAAVILGERLVLHLATRDVGHADLLGGTGDRRVKARVPIAGPVNILLVGIDSRPGQDPGDAVRADSITIVHVPADHKRAYLVSLPRDTYLPIPRYDNGRYRYPGGPDKINAAFALGGRNLVGKSRLTHGFQLLTRTIGDAYGLLFDAGAIVDFAGFQRVLDVLGGVDMCVDETTTSIHTGTTPDGRFAVPYRQTADLALVPVPGVRPVVYHPGCQHLAPWQALDYVRQRDLLAAGDGDYGRQRHQQQFLRAVFAEATGAGTLANPGKLSRLLDVVGKAVTVDDGGFGLDSWVYSMRGIRPRSVVAIATNGGRFDSADVPGLGSVENLTPASHLLLKAVADDRVGTFVADHPDWVAPS